jgi:hypothetical protein
VRITTFWVQGHGVREFIGAAEERSPRFQALENESAGMALTIGGARALVVVDVPEADIVDAFAKARPVV